MPLNLDLTTIAMPEGAALRVANGLSDAEGEIVFQMYAHQPRLERARYPRSANKPFEVTPNSPGSFYTGPGPIRSLVRKGVLVPREGEEESWTLTPLGREVGYALYLNATLATLRRCKPLPAAA